MASDYDDEKRTVPGSRDFAANGIFREINVDTVQGMQVGENNIQIINNYASPKVTLAACRELVKEVFTGPRDPERLPSQLIWPASGILTLILDKDAAALLPATDGQGRGLLERER